MKPTPLLSVRDLKVQFQVRSNTAWPWSPRPVLKAVDGVSFDLDKGEILGIVGESGCGKSTLARALLNLLPMHAGEVSWMGHALDPGNTAMWRTLRSDMQIIFQDPLASLDPRMTIAQIIAEPLRIHRPEMDRREVIERVRAVMAEVGLSAQHLHRYPHEFSGGQCQRIGIARALVLEPRLIICDEPVSALDVSIQAQIVNLLKDLQQRKQLTLIFIAHNLAVVKHISDRILVMYLGKVMEMADKDALFAKPLHPYTQALIASVPVPDPLRARTLSVPVLSGELPSPVDPPSGCVFRTRCPLAFERCAREVPELLAPAPRRLAACHLVEPAAPPSD